MSELPFDQPTTIDQARHTDPARAIGWALFLAASWTWCIGMFLPVLLVRDYGVAGWFIFAIPNVIGSAAMGWAIHTRSASLTMTARHSGAMRSFSVVTISFHAFFIPWIISQLTGFIARTLTGLPQAIAGG